MSIQWTYLNKRAATEAVLRDYENMKFIIEDTNDRIKETEGNMAAVHSPSWDGMPKVHNNNATEEKIMNGIEKIDILKERYRQAEEYMNWFQPAWKELSEDEKYCLEEFYMSSEQEQDCARFTVADKYHVDESTAYRRKNRALSHMQTLLFGKD